MSRSLISNERSETEDAGASRTPIASRLTGSLIWTPLTLSAHVGVSLCWKQTQPSIRGTSTALERAVCDQLAAVTLPLLPCYGIPVWREPGVPLWRGWVAPERCVHCRCDRTDAENSTTIAPLLIVPLEHSVLKRLLNSASQVNLQNILSKGMSSLLSKTSEQCELTDRQLFIYL